MDETKVTIRKDPTLFLETTKYHKRALKRLFLKYYEPLSTTGKVNKTWTIPFNKTDIQDLRIHLSWTIGVNTLDWEENTVGKVILELYQENNQFPFLEHVLKKYKKI